MRYKLLGRSGLRVSELCLGTMTFGEACGWGASPQVCQEMFDTFLEVGGNFIDTSTNYTDGQSEEILGKLIGNQRESLVLASKYSLTSVNSEDPNSGGNSRKNMIQTVERSLKRLQTEYLDLLYLHMWDYLTPVDLPAGWRSVKYGLLAAVPGLATFSNLGLMVFDPLTIFYRSISTSLLPSFNKLVTAGEYQLVKV